MKNVQKTIGEVKMGKFKDWITGTNVLAYMTKDIHDKRRI
jgi:hypothetical protein